MNSPSKQVTEVRFTPGSADDLRSGLLGWIACTLGGLVRLDGLTIRRTRGNRLTVSFPRGNRRYPPIRPLNQEARAVLEEQILAEIDLSCGGTW